MSYEYSEDRRAQQTSSNFLHDELGWEPALAWDDEILGQTAPLAAAATAT